MKQAIVMTLLTWGAIMLEQARPDVLPADVLLLPLVSVGMLWHGRGFGIMFGGALLVMDGIVRPHNVALLPIAVAFTATLILSRQQSEDGVRNGRSTGSPLGRWIVPLFPVLVGMLALFGPGLAASQMPLEAALSTLGRFLMIAVPWALLLTGLMLLAGEFGLRKST